MLKVDEIQNGVVIDHITAGHGSGALPHDGAGKAEQCQRGPFAERPQPKGRKKDIIKIEGDVSEMNFDVLAYVARKSPSPLSGTAG